MKKLTAFILILLLSGGALMGCQNASTNEETTKNENSQNNPVDSKPSEPVPFDYEPGKEYNLTSLPGIAFIKGSMNFTEGALEDVFDGTMATYANYNVDGGEEYYVGIRLADPAVLTNVQIWAPDYENDGIPNRPHVIYGMIVEGSNDGENWDFILQLGDIYSEYEEYAWDLDDGIADYFDEIPYDGEADEDDDALTPAAYTYYRIYNDTKGVAIWGDIALWGYFGEVGSQTNGTDVSETDASKVGDSLGIVNWEFVQKAVNGDKYTYLETNADVPASIEEFREPSVEPVGLIKKVLEQNGDYHLITYLQSEDDSYIDAMYAFWQYPIPPEGEAIDEGDGNADYTTEVNGYEALYHERQNKGLVLLWHDDQYYYNLSCLDKSVTLDELIEIAESVE